MYRTNCSSKKRIHLSFQKNVLNNNPEFLDSSAEKIFLKIILKTEPACHLAEQEKDIFCQKSGKFNYK
jgi:hypothetical protein